VAYENNDKKMESVYSQRIRAGKRRTYFFDVRETRGNDFYLTITESRKKFNEDGYDRHKIFLYKEDFNKFLKGMTEAIDYVKTELMPDFDFDAFNHDNTDNYEGSNYSAPNNNPAASASPASASEASASSAPEETTGSTESTSAPAAGEPAKDDSSDDDNSTNDTQHEEVDKW
jgi:hypothetical protein